MLIQIQRKNITLWYQSSKNWFNIQGVTALFIIQKTVRAIPLRELSRRSKYGENQKDSHYSKTHNSTAFGMLFGCEIVAPIY